jgi:alkanesulfonate monooxygenase SsuD/methylene tetrahydromethanopterin reductase-like flavin-dependent oxidoreductase (luciferase family)
VRVSVDTIKQLAKEKFGRNPDHIKFVAAVTVIVAETDEDAKLKRDEFLSYTDREGGLVLFGGWTGTDMSTYSDDEDFRFVKMPSINSIIDGWSKTVPGSEDLKVRISKSKILCL